MPISRTPKRPVEDDGDDTNMIHNPIFDSGHEPEKFEEGDGGAPVRKGPSMEEMADQLAELQRQLSEQSRSNFALLTQAPTSTQSNITGPEKVELPDVTVDPEGYAAAVRKQIQNENDFNNRRANEENSRKQSMKERVDGLWEDFGDQFPALAAKQDRVDFAAQKVIERANKRGLDVQKYMFVTSDQFLSDVADQMEKTFGTQEVDDEEDFTPSRRRSNQKTARRSRNRDDDETSRTAGIFGGNESGGKPAGKRQQADEGPDMIADMQAMQKKYGFI